MATASQSGANGTGRPSPGRVWLWRLVLAIGAPVCLALALEGSLRFVGFGRPTDLFIDDERLGYLRTNPAFTAPFFPEQFDIYPLTLRIARHKPPGHIRIFVLGESAVKGTPEPGFGFASLLAAQLRSAYPDRQFEVCNLGIVAINSHVVYQVAKQAARLEPDLFVVYMGNNEVVGPFGPGSVNAPAMPPLWAIRASAWVAGTRTGQLIQRIAGAAVRFASGRPLEWHGMSTFTERTVRGDDARLGAVYANYESNLRDIAAVAAHAGARMVLATVVANLRDCPPFASLHRAGISPSQLERWKAAYGDGVGAWETDRPAEAIRSVGEALKVDPEYAEAHFVLARLLEATGDEKGARAQYLEALHWDALRFRPEPEINGIARRVASESNGAVLLADSALEMGFGSTGPAPLPGREMLLEHVHFSWEGNVRMGRLIAGACASALFGAAVPPGHWLDSAGCADAVGYTPFGRLRMLQQMEPIREKPPFTNQITFGEDQVRYRHEVDVAESAATSAGGLEAAREQLESALGRSPQEANLALRLSEVEAQAGDSTGALRWLDRVLELEPRSPELLVQRARALEALRRAQEAQDSILEAIRMDAYNLPSYPALVDVSKETGDFELARSVLLGALSRNPSSGYIRLSYADLLFFHGEREKAEAECRAVLAIDPADPDPLGRLVSLYNAQGHSDRAFLLMQEARSTQPLNYENNLGLAKLYEAQGDEERAVDCLRAAERSGPAAPEAHIFIARHLAKMKQHREELVELHRARRVALLLGEEDLAHRISETIREATGNPAPGAPDNRH